MAPRALTLTLTLTLARPSSGHRVSIHVYRGVCEADCEAHARHGLPSPGSSLIHAHAHAQRAEGELKVPRVLPLPLPMPMVTIASELVAMVMVVVLLLLVLILAVLLPLLLPVVVAEITPAIIPEAGVPLPEVQGIVGVIHRRVYPRVAQASIACIAPPLPLLLPLLVLVVAVAVAVAVAVCRVHAESSSPAVSVCLLLAVPRECPEIAATVGVNSGFIVGPLVPVGARIGGVSVGAPPVLLVLRVLLR